ncbi:MAG: hypothetical protein LBV52_04855 [Spirochaetaceae bacterium]|jgi:hypothetical protein|nr:hypothetical protein [Spirochaetaceae bacterium]
MATFRYFIYNNGIISLNVFLSYAILLLVFIIANFFGLVLGIIKLKNIFLLIISFFPFIGMFWKKWSAIGNFYHPLLLLFDIIGINALSLVVVLCLMVIQKLIKKT